MTGFSKRALLIGVTLVFLFGRASYAQDLVFESGPRRVRLLELFTSEGCSSCPPAEASLSRLVNDSRLWRDFVPVAFHVDYWDRLGWKDPFASFEWTRRQQTYAENWKAESVYTPAFVLDGREWRNANVPAENAETPGVLKIVTRGDDAVTVDFQPSHETADELEVYLARLGFGVHVDIRAGENNGRNLRHDFVVLSLAHTKLDRGRNGPLRSYSVSGEMHFAPAQQSAAHPERSALAAWIAKSGEIKPVQATGGWLP
jgi:hypothetical protein